MPLCRILSPLGAACLLVACGEPGEESHREADTAPAPELTRAPAARTAPDGSALTEGAWHVREDANGASAAFGKDASEAELALTCELANNRLTLSVSAAASAPRTYRVAAGTETAEIEFAPGDGELPMLRAAIDPGRALITAFAQSNEIIRLTAPDGDVTQYPTSPAIERVLYACS